MKLKELYKKPLGEVLEKYCFVISLECDYMYGITTWEDAGKMFTEYDLEEDYISFSPEPLLQYYMELDEDNDEILVEKDLHHILENLGVKKKWLDENGEELTE